MIRGLRPGDWGELSDIPAEILEAYRYFCARIGIASGVLHEVSGEEGPDSDQLVCLDRNDGTLYAVTRPPNMSDAEEEAHIHWMRRLLSAALTRDN